MASHGDIGWIEVIKRFGKWQVGTFDAPSGTLWIGSKKFDNKNDAIAAAKERESITVYKIRVSSE